LIMTDRVQLENVAVVLQYTKYPENIGSAARAMANMGLKDLILVAPVDLDLPRVQKLATHAAGGIVERMQCAATLKAALAPFQYVVGTTARTGRRRQVIHYPEKMAEMLVPISRQNRIALVFGPEDRGLSNAALRYCHALVTIPTADFSSLNLAHAVMLMGYALLTAGAAEAARPTSRLAERHELDGMYAQLKEVLVKINYLQPENPDYFLNRIRRFFTRMQLRAREVSIIRGICRQISWYGKKCYEDGRRAGWNDRQRSPNWMSNDR